MTFCINISSGEFRFVGWKSLMKLIKILQPVVFQEELVIGKLTPYLKEFSIAERIL